MYNGHAIIQTQNGLCREAYIASGIVGYDAAGKADRIWEDGLIRNIGQQAPGVVIINGCVGMADPMKAIFMTRGTHLYMSWHRSITVGVSKLAGRKLIDDLLSGLTIQSAIDRANADPAIVGWNDSPLGLGDGTCQPLRLEAVTIDGNLNQTIYKLLGLRGPGNP